MKLFTLNLSESASSTKYDGVICGVLSGWMHSRVKHLRAGRGLGGFVEYDPFKWVYIREEESVKS